MNAQISDHLVLLRVTLQTVQKEFEQRKAAWEENRWYDAASAISQRLARIGDARIAKLQAKCAALDGILDDWREQLRDSHKDVAAFQERQRQHGQPLFVSRARRLPLQQFMVTQRGIESEVCAYVEKLRRSMTTLTTRIDRAQKLLAMKGHPSQTHSEALKSRMFSELGEVRERLTPVREKLLSQSGRCEESRRQLRALEEGMNQMLCVEDIGQPKRGINVEAWQKILRRMLPRKAPPSSGPTTGATFL
jgi:DNA repair exonuclease SbcCD ATPase subunit